MRQTHPATDTNILQEEAYDEGLAGVAEVEEPKAKGVAIDFHPDQDKKEAM